MSFLFRAARCVAAMSFLLMAGPVLAHEGHDHGAPAPAPSASLAPRAETDSDVHELVAIAREGVLVIYLDRFATNEPVDGAEIEIETPAGPQKAAARPGEPYRLDAPWSSKPGAYDLIFTVAKDGNVDVLPARLVIPDLPGAKAGPTSWLSTSAIAGEVGYHFNHDGPALFIAILAGLAAGIGVMALIRRRRRAAAMVLVVAGAFVLSNNSSRSHDGHDRAAPAAAMQSVRDLAQRLPDGGVFVPKSTQRILALRTVMTESRAHPRAIELPGRIIPDPNASGFVQASVGGRLSAPPGGFPRLGTPVKKGDVLAYVDPPLQAIDVSDMRQRQGELDQQISIVERRLARYETLVPSGAIARSQLEDTRSELQGLKDRRGSLDRARREPEALLAPVDGVVAEGTPVAGQIAQSNAVIFHIVDPTRLWVEARSFDPLAGVRSATANLGTDRTFTLVYQGSGFADRNQSIPVQFAIQGDHSGLRAGQFVTVLATTNEEKVGLAVPRASLVRNANGQEVVYEHVTPERFEQRPVRVEPLDGDRVLIATGLAGGKRLVVQGAELLNQVR
ncbi:efflux RND transporter periplasmic adaptor subunit [Bradyrhizobium sp. AUGA SZCCT0160]|uniref:efflux RND transporter periplasmic adaptor subunit n=1 Tax=Bradyrhizobium sp. AUGA SZCCT0160 TaxID=2807662 RepID=UPI001BA56B0D|nr:HlyD family efflux transporter periplasmic adaptor subunit [Bradyrhizobium sp. AUGA SZCCT0160]MBR1188014.1 HlyD family efflux transporter periplasmic adaptor subunit [Bradyrhizobium sp. AUGA SZCCT0160]MBR1188251.1 HlyD family efflux transporter periplasmic adaptor subunit [Bradyrhizobium sp. AUGA SZCCT0160]